MQGMQSRFASPGTMDLVAWSVPDPEPGEIRLSVKACGICGSDLHSFHGQFPTAPVCPGHEISGVIDALGNSGKHWREGDAVVVEPLWRCGQCAYCKQGNYHQCEKFELYGATRHGGLASHILVPECCLFALPSTIDHQLGALAEPLAVAVHSLRQANLGPDSSVLILGAGSIGLLTIAAALHLGAGFVAITARYPHQKKTAKEFGCHQVLDPNELDQIKEKPNLVIETVGGTATTLIDAIRTVTPGGQIMVTGLFTQSPAIDPMSLVMKEVSLKGSMVYNCRDGIADFEIALDILEGQNTRLNTLITHRYPLQDIQQGFALAGRKDAGAIKVLIEPGA